MINKKYEKTTIIFIIIYLLIFLEIIFFISLNYYKINKYQVIKGIVYTDELLLVMVNKENKNDIYSNSFFYINNKKVKYSIYEEKEMASDDYYQLLLKVDSCKYKINDTLDISIKRSRDKLITIFKIIWEDD